LKGPLPLAVLVSGRGSNLRAIVNAAREGKIHAQVRIVISNRPACPGIEFARQAGIETFVLGRRDAGGRAAQMAGIADAAAASGAEWVVLAGFDRLVSGALLGRFAGRIINIHPSLLPAFGGSMAPGPQSAAIDAGVKYAGCTVHLVTDEPDAGPILDQAVVRVFDGDDPQRLADRILAAEHRLLPSVIDRLARRKLRVTGQRTSFSRMPGV
jgi:phosphoribosylglycinamide formyltransferase-1